MLREPRTAQAEMNKPYKISRKPRTGQYDAPDAQQMFTNDVKCARKAMGQISAAYAVVRV